ncbi:MAG: hypothetical protein JNL82_28090 [Myxococcales bacterium]|jgi:hypothetical protein|nr:hypothetical protein [Myxococcales bacterium]
MLKIRTAQEDALADEDFVRRLIAHIQTRAPDSAARLTYAQLRSVVRHGIRVARSYDLTSERDLAAFTLDMLAVNPEFHRQYELSAILKNPDTPIDERMDRLLGASDPSWDEAATMTDAAVYWQNVLDSDPESSLPDPTPGDPS